MGLNCVGTLLQGFPSLNTAVLHGPQLLEFANAKNPGWGGPAINYMGINTLKLFKGQLY